MTFTDHLERLTAEAIAAIPAAEAPDVYALSFFIDNEDDDPRRPVLTVGYNTDTQVGRTLHNASNPAEARWNYAFWLQNELTVVGDRNGDPPGAAARDEWIRELGLWYEEEVTPTNWETIGRLAQQIESRFSQAVCQLASRLHAAGIIETALGRPVPVVVHELEYYESIALRTDAANPSGLADDFTAWVRNG